MALTNLPNFANGVVAGEIELPVGGLDKIPEDVGGDRIQATRFHLQNGFFPLLLRIALGVELAGYDRERFAVMFKVPGVGPDLSKFRIYPSPVR